MLKPFNTQAPASLSAYFLCSTFHWAHPTRLPDVWSPSSLPSKTIATHPSRLQTAWLKALSVGLHSKWPQMFYWHERKNWDHTQSPSHFCSNTTQAEWIAFSLSYHSIQEYSYFSPQNGDITCVLVCLPLYDVGLFNQDSSYDSPHSCEHKAYEQLNSY